MAGWKNYYFLFQALRILCKGSLYLYLPLRKNNQTWHCVKSVRLGSYSGLYSARMWENTDQNNYKYGQFSRSVNALKSNILTHFTPMLYFIWKSVIWLALQIKWLIFFMKYNSGLKWLKSSRIKTSVTKLCNLN